MDYIGRVVKELFRYTLEYSKNLIFVVPLLFDHLDFLNT